MYRERRWRLPGERRKSKYLAQTATYDGRTYHSRLEARVAFDLDMRLKAGELTSVEPQVRVSLDVNGRHVCNYIVDFRVTHADGTVELVEAKGFETEVYRLKRRLLEATVLLEHPEIVYTVVKG